MTPHDRDVIDKLLGYAACHKAWGGLHGSHTCQLRKEHASHCQCGCGARYTFGQPALETRTEAVGGVLSGSDLEKSIQQARAEIATWPTNVKRAMGIEEAEAPVRCGVFVAPGDCDHPYIGCPIHDKHHARAKMNR